MKSVKIRQMYKGIVAVMLDETILRRQENRTSATEGVQQLI